MCAVAFESSVGLPFFLNSFLLLWSGKNTVRFTFQKTSKQMKKCTIYLGCVVECGLEGVKTRKREMRYVVYSVGMLNLQVRREVWTGYINLGTICNKW